MSELPQTCLPTWTKGELPEPPPWTWRNWTGLIGPGIVMMGIQIGGGEWLFGPEITARYGGGLMWIASIAILLQVVYNLECGRYALYCGEPVFTGFMRTRPGPAFWISVVLLLNCGALIPGLSTHGAAMIAALMLDRPPGVEDRLLVTTLSYLMLGAVVLPVLFGGRVYNTLQTVMTAKVVCVLGFCLLIGVFFVRWENWWRVSRGFAAVGTLPAVDERGEETTVNVPAFWWEHGTLPAISLANIAVLGAFAGYAGGGGLSNSTYSNFVRDKGWGMGRVVGAIPSAIGGRHVQLSHLGAVFAITPENMERWRGWWRYVLRDQLWIWMPGCFVGMALPALISLEFAQHSTLAGSGLEWSQALITADGIRHAPQFGPAVAQALWVVTIIVGLMVMLPSQMAIVDDFSRRWTDIIWSGSSHVRDNFAGNEVKRIYYIILGAYVLWSAVAAYLFSKYGTPKLMTIVIANLNNLALGLTAIHLWWINRTLLPRPLRPGLLSQLGVLLCAAFYLGMAVLVFVTKQLPALVELWG